MLYFLNCVNKWCHQDEERHGHHQYTKCDSASSDGKTCYNPQIRENDLTGRPTKETKHSDTEQSEGLLQWCKQLFPYAKKGMAVYSSDTSSISGQEGVYWSYPNNWSPVCAPYMWCQYIVQTRVRVQFEKEKINCERSNNLHGCVMTSVTCE